MNLLLLSLASVFVAGTSAMIVDIEKCPDSQAFVNQVGLSPCDKNPCTFKHGDTVTVNINFTATADTEEMEAKVYGIVFHEPVPFPLPQPNACKDSGIKCPVKKGQQYYYKNSFPVLDIYPKISLIVEWKLVGTNGDEACFQFPMAIQ